MEDWVKGKLYKKYRNRTPNRVAIKILIYLSFNFGTLIISLLGLVTVAQCKNSL